MATKKQIKNKNNPAQKYIDGLKFIKPLCKKSNGGYCYIDNNIIAATTRITAIGVLGDYEIECSPDSNLLNEALKKVGDDLSITHSDIGLTVTSGEMSVLVPCCEPLFIPSPIPPQIDADWNLHEGLSIVSNIPDEKATEAYLQGVLFNQKSVSAMSEFHLIERFHELTLPDFNVIIPKQSAKIVGSIKHQLTGIGLYSNMLTFWFGSDKFVSTALLAGKFPEFEHIFKLSKKYETSDIPEKFFEAVEMIGKYSNGVVYFNDGCMASGIGLTDTHYNINVGAENLAFDSKLLMDFKKGFNLIHFNEEDEKVLFFGKGIRGVCSSMDIQGDLDVPF